MLTARTMPLTDFVHHKRRSDALREYKARIYYRGLEPTKHGQLTIPKRILREEERRDFATKGVFQKRLRHFVDGVVIGSNDFVAKHLARLVDDGVYTRRKNPIQNENKDWYALRPQRAVAAA